jgi:hypothetical protein
MDRLRKLAPPKSWAKMSPDVEIIATSQFALERPVKREETKEETTP